MKKGLIWDLPTRIIHWSLAFSVVLNLFVIEEGDDCHRWSGYVAAGAVGLRLLWSFFGSRPRWHNRIAASVYLGLWACILGLGLTGWLMGTDKYWGEQWLEDIHANISLALQVLIGIHLLGIFIDSVRHRRASFLAMVTGRRPASRAKPTP